MATKRAVGGLANKVIAYAFTVGVILALVVGLIGAWIPMWLPVLTSLLILAGIVVGFFNISPTETRDYVLFVTALVIVTSLGQSTLSKLQYVGPVLESVLQSIMVFVLPSVVIVGIKAVLNLAKD